MLCAREIDTNEDHKFSRRYCALELDTELCGLVWFGLASNNNVSVNKIWKDQNDFKIRNGRIDI